MESYKKAKSKKQKDKKEKKKKEEEVNTTGTWGNEEAYYGSVC